jgi:predicted nucleic acid-binding protein
MILVDTSLWIQHFRADVPALHAALNNFTVVMHADVLGELAVGNLANRKKTLERLSSLPFVLMAEPRAALEFVEIHRLYGRGLGWVDIHLLYAARVGAHVLWTLDGKLAEIARAMGISTAGIAH